MHPAVGRATDSDEPRTRCWLGLARIVRNGCRRRNRQNHCNSARGGVAAAARRRIRSAHEPSTPRAGQPAQPADLVDVDALARAPTTTSGPIRRTPPSGSRSARPATAARRSRRAFNEAAHPGHDRGDLPLPAGAGLRAGRCSSAATRTPSRSPPGGPRSRCWSRTASTSGSMRATGTRPTPAVSHAILVANRDRPAGGRRLADGIVVTPSHNPPEDGGFKYNPPNGGPGRHRRHALDPGRGEPDPRGVGRRRARRRSARVPFEQARAQAERLRLPRHVRRDLEHVVDMAAIAASGLRIGVDPAGWRGGRLLGR